MDQVRGAGKYWENEEPKVIETPKNIVKWYVNAGKIQFFNKIETAKYTGLSKGVTIDLASMPANTITGLFAFFQEMEEYEMELLEEEMKESPAI